MISDFKFSYNIKDSCFSFIASNSSSSSTDVNTWHVHLGHNGQDRMNHLTMDDLFGQFGNINLPICEQCLARKSTRKHFGKKTKAEFPLQLIHSDICERMATRAMHGASYSITFIDDYSRYGVVYLMSYKSKALSFFRFFFY